MLSDGELGELLRGQLQASARDIQPSPELLERLAAIGQDKPSRNARSGQSRSRPRILASVALVIAVFVAVAVLTLGGSSTPRAFAVATSADGSVVVTLDDLTGVAGANAELSQLGVRARVVPMTASCGNHLSVSYMGVTEDPAPMIKLIPSEISPTTTVILAAAQTGSNHVEMATGEVTGPAPSCVSLSGLASGLPTSPATPQSQRPSDSPK